MARPQLIVIADDRGRSTLPMALTNGSVRVIDCRDVGGFSSIGNAPVLIDVDLHDILKVKLIKDNLPDRVGDQCRIIAVDRASHLSMVQAKSLGASDVISAQWIPAN